MSLDCIKFDFEDNMKQVEGISHLEGPERVKEAIRLHLKYDNRAGLEVCHHWLRGLCQKGEECEYLHKYVHERVPDCPNGVFCVNPDCPFSHGSKAECILYNQGFCPFGPNCLRVHVKKTKDQLPPIEEVLKKVKPTLDKSQQQQQQSTAKPAVPTRSDKYKTSLCNNFLLHGVCIYGDKCIYAHGESELIIPERNNPNNQLDDSQLLDSNLQPLIPTLPDRRTLDLLGLPVTHPDTTRFYMMKSYNKNNFILSIRDNIWRVPNVNGNILNIINNYKDNKNIYFFCSIMFTNSYFGVCTLKSCPELVEGDVFEFKVEWIRYTYVQFEICNYIGDYFKPLIKKDDMEEISYTPAMGLMEILYRHDSLNISDEPEGGWSFDGRVETSNDIEYTPISNIPLIDREGYMFVVTKQTIYECLEKQIFGVSERYASNIEFITPGTIIFLYDSTDHIVYGAYEALTYPIRNVEPYCFINRNTKESPYPIQIRVGQLYCNKAMAVHMKKEEVIPILYNALIARKLSIPEVKQLLTLSAFVNNNKISDYPAYLQPVEKDDHFEQYIQFGIDPSIDDQEDNIKRKLKDLNHQFNSFNSKISLKEYGWKTKLLIRAPTIDILHYILVYCIGVCEEARSIYMNNLVKKGEKLQRLENVIIPQSAIIAKSKRKRSVSRSASKSPKRRKERSRSKHRDDGKSEKRHRSHSRNRSKERSRHSHSRDSRRSSTSNRHGRDHDKKRK